MGDEPILRLPPPLSLCLSLCSAPAPAAAHRGVQRIAAEPPALYTGLFLAPREPYYF